MDFDVSPYLLALDGNNSLSIDSLGFIAITQLENTYWGSLSHFILTAALISALAVQVRAE